MATPLDEAKQSLQRIQEFDPETLPREDELGQAFSFRPAVAPARKLIGLYKQLSLTTLDDLPDGALNQIKDLANADFNRLQQILDFDAKQPDPGSQRDGFVQQLTDAYPGAFDTLERYISYGVAKSADFRRLETEARAMIQGFKDEAQGIISSIEGLRDEASSVLEEVRTVAAEHGVSQQAVYFNEEAVAHEAAAKKWRTGTNWMAVLLGAYAVSTIFLHKWQWMAPKTDIESLQLVASKVLVFAVISYVLLLAARNFLSHKHNAIVNKHRQNALMTFKALVEAAGEPAKDVVLMHAAACIFEPQETGYAKSSRSVQGSGRSVVEFLPSMVAKGAADSS